MTPSLKQLSIGSKGLRYKLIISFCLMSVIPILVLGYVVSVYLFPALDILSDFYIFPPQKIMHTLSVIVLLAVLTSMLGLYIARMTIDRVVSAAWETKMIASGRYERKIKVGEDDEVGDIVKSVNTMAEMIRTDLEEFRKYSQRTQEINVEIRKNLLALSGLLQVADLISGGSIESSEIMEFILDRVSQIVDSSYAILFLHDKGIGALSVALSHNVEGERFKDVTVAVNKGILGKALFSKTIVVIDKTVADKETDEFKKTHNVRNLVGVPIYSRKRAIGMLLIGNRLEDFKFLKDEIEFYKVFAKQVVLVLENDLLVKKVKELAIKDDLTGLFTENYIKGILEDEINRSIFFQRPCSFNLFNVDDFRVFRDTYGDVSAEEALKKVAQILKHRAGPVGKAARIGGDGFALLLPEKNKKEAMQIAEELRKEIESTSFVPNKPVILTISGGVGENPLDGSTADAIFTKATKALEEAKSHGKNRIVA